MGRLTKRRQDSTIVKFALNRIIRQYLLGGIKGFASKILSVFILRLSHIATAMLLQLVNKSISNFWPVL